MAAKTIKLTCDAGPLISCLDSLSGLLQSGVRSLKVGNIPAELFNVEVADHPTVANERVIRFRPSDALLGYESAVRAGEVDGNGIEKAGHDVVPSPASRAGQ